MRIPRPVIAHNDIAAIDTELDSPRPTLPTVVAEHFLDLGREGSGYVVPATTVRAPSEESAVWAQSHVEGAVGERGLVLVHPLEERGVLATQILLVLSVVPDQEPGSVVPIRHMVWRWLDRFVFFLIRHGSLHIAEELVIFERWGFRFRLIGVRIWKKPFELFGGVFGPSLIQGRGKEGGFFWAEGEEKFVLRLWRGSNVLFAHGDRFEERIY